MFVTFNQFYVFIASIAFGGLGGLFYSPILLVKEKINNLSLAFFLDIIYFLVLSISFLFYSYWLKFPSFRAYMLFGVFVGIILYVKSFHNILAKVIKKVYNIFRKFFVLRKNAHDRRKG